MVVADSSALIPLARVGRLDLISALFDTVHTTEDVQEEVITEGQPGTSALASFLDGVMIHERPSRAKELSSLEGIATADASVVLIADTEDESLLANDKGLIEVARSHGINCWWVTTVLLGCVRDGILTADEATDVLYELVNKGMNLDPKIYTKVQRKLGDLGET